MSIEKIKKLYESGVTLLYIRTDEPYRLENEIRSTIHVPVYTWSMASGLIQLEKPTIFSKPCSRPMESLTKFFKIPDNAILIIRNAHILETKPIFKLAIFDNLPLAHTSDKMIILTSPLSSVPIEFNRYSYYIDYQLPTKEEIESIIQNYAKVRNLTVSNIQDLVSASIGLTKYEISQSLELSYRELKEINLDYVYQQKMQLISKNSVLELHRPTEEDRFDMIGGLNNLKQFLKRSVHSDLSKGVLLLGVPGTGKSAIAKALGYESKLPVVKLDFAKVFGSKVGESEAKMRSALSIIDAISPCILFIDELEKGIGGINSSHNVDGGTGQRVFSSFLTWLNDHKSKVYVIATSNNLSLLPSEFIRSERWDAIFFVDIPTYEERQQIWKIWKSYYGISDNKLPEDDNWTGAEIKTCCRLSKVLNTSLEDASKYIVPIYKAMEEQIDYLREWAETRCIKA